MNKRIEALFEQDTKRRYKMYKAGRRWLFAGIAFFGVGSAMLMGGNMASADTNTPAPDVNSTQQSGAPAKPSTKVVRLGTVSDSSTGASNGTGTESSSAPKNTKIPATSSSLVGTHSGDTATQTHDYKQSSNKMGETPSTDPASVKITVQTDSAATVKAAQAAAAARAKELGSHTAKMEAIGDAANLTGTTNFDTSPSATSSL